MIFSSLLSIRSHPVRVRGLKPLSAEYGHFYPVAPRAGAWIETVGCYHCFHGLRVAPRAGAWIET